MTVDLQAVVRNNTEKSYIAFTQFAHMITSCHAVVPYHNQDIDINVIYQSCSNDYLDSFVWMCLCVPLCTSIQIYHVWICVFTTRVKIQNIFITTRICHVAFLYSHLPPTLPSVPNPWQSLICSPFNFLILRMLCINGILLHVIFLDWLHSV